MPIIIQYLDTMGDLPDTMGDLPDTMGDLPDTMSDLPDTIGDLPDTMGDIPAPWVSWSPGLVSKKQITLNGLPGHGLSGFLTCYTIELFFY